MKIAAPTLLAAFLCLLASPASATDLPPDVALQLPVGPVTRTYTTDQDGDGRLEDNRDVGFSGACACACPVVGAGTEFEAAGQEGDVSVAVVSNPICGFRVHTELERGNAVDPFGAYGVDPYLICWPDHFCQVDLSPIHELIATSA